MMRKRFISFTMLLMLLFTMFNVPTAYASNLGENDVAGLSIEAGSEKNISIGTYGIKQPSEYVDLPSYGKMDFSGNASTSSLFLNKGFTGVTGIYMWCQNFHPTATLVVNVRTYSFWGMWGPVVKSFTFEVGTGGGMYLNGLDINEKYYLEFTGPSNFSGYVTAN